MDLPVRQIKERLRRLGSPPTRRATKPSRPEDQGGGGGGLRWAVARRIDENEGCIFVHYLSNAANPPQAGAWQASGDEVKVYPLPGQIVTHYNIPGVMTPLAVPLEDEQLGLTFVPLLVLPDLTAIIMPVMPAGVETVSQNGQGSEGSGV